MKHGLIVILVALAAASVAAQKHTAPHLVIFIDDIKGDEPFIAERFKLLFMEKLGALRGVEFTEERDEASHILDGIGRIERQDGSSFSATATPGFSTQSGSAGTWASALLSIRLTDLKTNKPIYIGNESRTGDRKRGATEAAVDELVKDLKKRLNLRWK